MFDDNNNIDIINKNNKTVHFTVPLGDKKHV